MYLKILQIFIDVSNEHCVSVLSHYAFLQYSQTGSSKLHPKFLSIYKSTYSFISDN